MSDLDLPGDLFLYLTDGLDDAERERVALLLESGGDPVLAALADATALLAELPDALDPVAPPTGAREDLLARANRSVATPTPLRTEPSPSASPPVGFHTRDRVPTFAQRWGVGRAFVWGAVAASALWVVVGGTAWREQQHAHEIERVRLTTQVEEELRLAAASQLREEELIEARELAIELRRVAEQALLAGRERIEASEQSPESGREEQLAATDPTRKFTGSDADKVEALKQQIGRLQSGAAKRAAASLQATARLAQQEERIAALERTLDASDRALELVRAPDVGIVDLFAVDESLASSASVFWDGGLRHCYLHARALPQAKQGEHYALWLEYESGRILRIADFEVNDRGDAEFFEDLPVGQGEIVRTFVTKEPHALANRPLGPLVLEALTPAPGQIKEGSPDGRRKYRRRTT